MTGGQLEISVADEVQGILDLETLPQVDGQDVSFTETKTLDLILSETQSGFNITIRYLGDSSVIIDEFTVSNANDIAAAEAHLRAGRISTAAQNNLISFIASIDQQSAPDDDETNIFENSDEPNQPIDNDVPTDDDEFCFPVIARNGNIAMICL